MPCSLLLLDIRGSWHGERSSKIRTTSFRDSGKKKSVARWGLPKSALAAITKCHGLGGLNNRNVFLTVRAAAKSKIKVLANSVSGAVLSSWFRGGCLLDVSSCERKRKRESENALFLFAQSRSPIRLDPTITTSFNFS